MVASSPTTTPHSAAPASAAFPPASASSPSLFVNPLAAAAAAPLAKNNKLPLRADRPPRVLYACVALLPELHADELRLLIGEAGERLEAMETGGGGA